MLWPQNLKKYDLCWEEMDFFGGVVVCSLGEESWDGKEEGEIME